MPNRHSTPTPAAYGGVRGVQASFAYSIPKDFIASPKTRKRGNRKEEERVWDMIDKLPLPPQPSSFWDRKKLWKLIEIFPHELMSQAEVIWDSLFGCIDTDTTYVQHPIPVYPMIDPNQVADSNAQQQGTTPQTTDSSPPPEKSDEPQDNSGPTNKKIRFKLTESYAHKANFKRKVNYKPRSDRHSKPKETAHTNPTDANDSGDSKWTKVRSLTIEMDEGNNGVMENLKEMFGVDMEQESVEEGDSDALVLKI